MTTAKVTIVTFDSHYARIGFDRAWKARCGTEVFPYEVSAPLEYRFVGEDDYDRVMDLYYELTGFHFEVEA